MSIPESILSSVKTDLANVTTANGYQNTFLPAYEGYLSSNEVNEDLKPYYFLNEANTIVQVSAYNYGIIQAELVIAVQFSSDMTEGALTSKCETILNDLVKWKNTDCKIGSIVNVDFLYIQNQYRIFEWDKNSGTAKITILIQYKDNI